MDCRYHPWSRYLAEHSTMLLLFGFTSLSVRSFFSSLEETFCLPLVLKVKHRGKSLCMNNAQNTMEFHIRKDLSKPETANIQVSHLPQQKRNNCLSLWTQWQFRKAELTGEQGELESPLKTKVISSQQHLGKHNKCHSACIQRNMYCQTLLSTSGVQRSIKCNCLAFRQQCTLHRAVIFYPVELNLTRIRMSRTEGRWQKTVQQQLVIASSATSEPCVWCATC